MSMRNRLHRYELIGDELQNGKLLLDLPATPRTHHNGGSDLNQNRTQIAPSTHNDTNTEFTEKIANNIEESKDAVFASSFPGITNLEVELDGYLYVLGFHKSLGRIHKIVPR